MPLHSDAPGFAPHCVLRIYILVAEPFRESEPFLMSSKHLDEKPISMTPLSVVLPDNDSSKDIALLDLYSGCGGMSTGLCVGAKLSSTNLVTVMILLASIVVLV